MSALAVQTTRSSRDPRLIVMNNGDINMVTWAGTRPTARRHARQLLADARKRRSCIQGLGDVDQEEACRSWQTNGADIQHPLCGKTCMSLPDGAAKAADRFAQMFLPYRKRPLQ